MPIIRYDLDSDLISALRPEELLGDDTEVKTESEIEKIHRIRREISDRFGGDIAATANDAARRMVESGRPIWQPNTTNQC